MMYFMNNPSSIVILLVTFALRTLQFVDSYNTQNICPGLSNDANATGVEPINRTDHLGSTIYGDTSEVGQWKVSVRTNHSANSIESAGNPADPDTPNAVANIWLDPYEGVDLNDGELAYSACAYLYTQLPVNTNLRGQDDDTTCEQMLSKSCVEELTKRAALTAQYLVQSPTLGPYSNLTPPILTPICRTILGEIGSYNADDWPDQCRPYFFTGDQNSVGPDTERTGVSQWVLTSNKTRPRNCTLSEDFVYSNAVFQFTYNVPAGIMSPYHGKSPAEAYDRLVHQVWPILTVTMPPANVSRADSREYYNNDARAKMTCIRAKDIKQGSRVPPALPKPGPVHFPRSASWYGVRVGVPIVVVVAVLAAALAGYCIWRRKRKNGDAFQNVDKVIAGEDINQGSSVQKDGSEVYQLAGQQSPVQLQAAHKVEMDAGERVPRYAKGNDGKPQEMDAGLVPAKAKVVTRRLSM